MKTKTSTFLFTLLAIGLSQLNLKAQEIYHGNSDWSDKSEYFPIVEENFQDWDYTDADGYGLKTEKDLGGCASTARDDVDMYATFDVQRPIDSRQGVTGNFTFHLDFCLIQTACDTQSGEYYSLFGEAGLGGDNQGPTWTNVSAGSIAIYDNFNTVRPVTMGVGGDGSGSITTSKITTLERVQYTTSSYGKKRGFNLEIGYEYDGTIYWDTVRYMTGNLNTTRPDAVASEVDGYIFDESNRGWVFEEKFNPAFTTNVYLRFRPTAPLENRQIVRIHDLKIYGEMSQEDATPVAKVEDNYNLIMGTNGYYQSTEPVDVSVYNLSGSIVKQFTNTTTYNITDLTSGIYIIRAVTTSGKMVVRKVVL